MINYKYNKSDSTGELVKGTNLLCQPEKLKDYKNNQDAKASIGSRPSLISNAIDEIKENIVGAVESVRRAIFDQPVIDENIVNLQPDCNKILKAINDIRDDATETNAFLLSQENCNYSGGDIINTLFNLLQYKKSTLTPREAFEVSKDNSDFIDNALVELPQALNGLTNNISRQIAIVNSLDSLDNTLYFNLSGANYGSGAKIDRSTLTQTEIDAFESTGNSWVLS